MTKSSFLRIEIFFELRSFYVWKFEDDIATCFCCTSLFSRTRIPNPTDLMTSARSTWIRRVQVLGNKSILMSLGIYRFTSSLILIQLINVMRNSGWCFISTCHWKQNEECFRVEFYSGNVLSVSFCSKTAMLVKRESKQFIPEIHAASFNWESAFNDAIASLS